MMGWSASAPSSRPWAALAAGGLVRAEILSADGSEVQAGEGAPAELARRLLAAASPELRAMFGR
jgi:hypothetical protein